MKAFEHEYEQIVLFAFSNRLDIGLDIVHLTACMRLLPLILLQVSTITSKPAPRPSDRTPHSRLVLGFVCELKHFVCCDFPSPLARITPPLKSRSEG